MVYSIFHIEYEILGIVALSKQHVRTLLTYGIILVIHSVSFLAVCVVLVSNGHSYLVFIKSALLFVQLWLVWHNLIQIAEFKHRAFLNSVPMFRYRSNQLYAIHEPIANDSTNTEMLMVTMRPLGSPTIVTTTTTTTTITTATTLSSIETAATAEVKVTSLSNNGNLNSFCLKQTETISS